MSADNRAPPDFPRGGHEAFVPGAAPKYVAKLEQGKFSAGLSEQELFKRYQLCNLLAQDMVLYCRDKAKAQPDWPTQFLLDRTAVKVESQGWGYTVQEIGWVIQEVARQLGTNWNPQRWRLLEPSAAIRGEEIYTRSP